jgi:hypothetical protein
MFDLTEYVSTFFQLPKTATYFSSVCSRRLGRAALPVFAPRCCGATAILQPRTFGLEEQFLS